MVIKSAGWVYQTVPSVLRALYIASVFFAVLEFGAVGTFPVALSAIFSSVVAVLCLCWHGGPCRGRWLFLTILTLGGLIFTWVWLQTLRSLPSGLSNALWSDLYIASLPATGTISIAPSDSLHTLLFLAIPLTTFLTGMIVIRSDDDARKILNVIGLGGALFAFYGITQLYLFPDINLFLPKEFYIDSLTATFINRNTAGTFFGLATLVAFRHMWSLGNHISIRRVLHGLLNGRKIDESGLTAFCLAGLCLACVVLALFLTKSRGAIASSFLAMGFMLFCLLIQSDSGRKRQFHSQSSGKAYFRIFLTMLSVTAVVAVFGGRTLLRAEVQGATDGRYCVLPGIMQLAKGTPVFGYGFGSFTYAFPPFREADCGLPFIWTKAHNVFLEGFISLGLLFPLIVILGSGALIVAHVIGFRERRQMRSYSVAGLAGIILLGLHSMVDFSIEIPGLAAYAAALLAATSSTSLGKSKAIRSGTHQ